MVPDDPKPRFAGLGLEGQPRLHRSGDLIDEFELEAHRHLHGIRLLEVLLERLHPRDGRRDRFDNLAQGRTDGVLEELDRLGAEGLAFGRLDRRLAAGCRSPVGALLENRSDGLAGVILHVAPPFRRFREEHGVCRGRCAQTPLFGPYRGCFWTISALDSARIGRNKR